MFPILFESNEQNFTSNGLGRLTDATSCIVTEERNGIFELEMQYPLDGAHYDDIAYDRILFCRTCDAVAMQPFRIYRISRPLAGIVTVYARHISYDLNKIVVAPFTEPSITQLFLNLPSHALNNCPFTFSTDKTVTADFDVAVPSSIRSLMGGSEGSILDVYGTGEYKYDKYNVYLYLHRGADNGVTIRYGKNLTDAKKDEDGANVFNAVAPYWQGEDGTVVTTPTPVYGASVQTAYTDSGGNQYTDGNDPYTSGTSSASITCIPLDLSDKFETQPTVQELAIEAASWLTANTSVVPKENINISFVHLWQTNEYKNYAPLQRVNLCDTVTVIYTKLGVSVTAKVIKTVYDVLRERYNSMELGTPRSTLSNTIISTEQAVKEVEQEAVSKTFMEQAIDAATDLITGGLGGYVVIKKNANGQPEEILIMNTASTSTAMNVIRMNQNGIGFSTNGINGPFTTAWTINGAFVADFITAGTLKTILIQGPTALTFWDLATGIFQNYGTSQVTAQVETAQGTYTPTQYTINHKTRIASGKLSLKGQQTGGTERTYMDVGLAAEGMNYEYYESVYSTGHSTSYPYASVDLYGDQIDGLGERNLQTGGEDITYTPAGHYTPDYLIVGAADNISDIVYNPDRNTMKVAGGWGTYTDALVYTQYYTWDVSEGVVTRTFYDGIERRPSWEYAIGDVVRLFDDNMGDNRIICAGYITDSQTTLWFQLPLTRPFARDVDTVTLEGSWKARLEGSYIAGGGSSYASLTDYTITTKITAAGLSVKVKKNNNGTWASGNNNHAVTVDLYDDVYMTCAASTPIVPEEEEEE